MSKKIKLSIVDSLKTLEKNLGELREAIQEQSVKRARGVLKTHQMLQSAREATHGMRRNENQHNRDNQNI